MTRSSNEPSEYSWAQRRALMHFVKVALAAADETSRREQLPALEADLPLHLLPRIAASHRIEGCLHKALAEVPGIPDDVIDALHVARQRAGLRHLMSVRSIANLETVLADVGVPMLIFKGPVLTSMLYRDGGLRSYADVDVLVPQQRFAHAVRALERAGYEHLVQNWKAVRHFAASELTMAIDEIPIDLHWHVLYAVHERERFNLHPDELLARARTATIAGRQVLTFDSVDTLMHLCLHAARSGGHTLIWLKDIERSLAVDRPDLDELVERARRARCAPSVGIVIHRVNEVFGLELPRELVGSLVGRPLAALDSLTTRFASPTLDVNERSMSRLLTQSAGPSLSQTAVDLVRYGYYAFRPRVFQRTHLDKHDPENPMSLLHPSGDESDKSAYLDAVSRAS